MTKTALCLLILLQTVFFLANSQGVAFPVDEEVPALPLDEKTELTILNSRLGSRFSLSLVSQDNGIHTGALGFDADAFSELLIQLKTSDGKYSFRTGALPPGGKYLDNQSLRLGMTSMQLKGETPQGLKLTFTLVSPFTPSENLADEEAIKVQIAPNFYLLAHLENESGKAVDGELRVGLKQIPYSRERQIGKPSWTYGSPIPEQAVFFRDIAGDNTLIALANVGEGAAFFKEGAYFGLATPFSLAAGTVQDEQLIYATHHAGPVQYDRKYNQALRFYYTKYWGNMDEVIAYARDNAQRNIEKAARFEELLRRSNASPEEKWVLALTFHTDLANTFFLLDEEGHPRFLVLEGRFRHQSTIDVAHETALAALFAPWRLQLQLDQWMDYMARQEVVLGVKNTERGPEIVKEGMSASEYGPFLYHDVGNYPYMDKTSMYDYGPHMAVEENANYVLLLYWYWKLSGDDAFVAAKLGMVEALLHSLTNRDTDDSGIADMGIGWSTYDVSEAIKRSPENVYLGVKQMCAYLLAADMFRELARTSQAAEEAGPEAEVQDGDGQGFNPFNLRLANEKLREKQAHRYEGEAEKIAASLRRAFKQYGYIPVSLDQSFEGWDQHSVVLGEGLMYPGLCGYRHPLLEAAAGYLGNTYRQALEKSRTPYGIRLSSGEGVTWFSKVMVSDLVAALWYDTPNSTAAYTYAWNKNNPNAYNDGAYSAERDWIGYWYPRGISSLGYFLRERAFKAEEAESFLKGLK